MKFFFTLILCVLFSLDNNAQDLSLSDSIIIFQDVDPNDDYIRLGFGELSITNNSTDSIDLGFIFKPTCLEDDDPTRINLCLAHTCLGIYSDSTTLDWDGVSVLKLAPNQTYDSLKITLWDVAPGLKNEWEITFYDKSDQNNKVDLAVTLGGGCEDNNTSTGTDNYIKLEKAAYPNPANDFINIPLPKLTKPSICSIYNALGNLVKSIRLDNTNATLLLDISRYHSGLYYYQISNEKETSILKSFYRN